MSKSDATLLTDNLSSIYNAAPVGLCVLDRDLRYVRVNDRLAEINGLPAADHIGRTVHEVVPDLSDQSLDTMQRVLCGEEVWGVEFSGITRAHPALRTWRENWLPLRDDAGAIVGMAISVEEVTDEKAAQAALRESEERARQSREELQLLADSLPALIAYVDVDRRYRFVNQAYQSWFPSHWEAGLIGQTVEEVVGATAYAAVKDKMDAVLAGEPITFEQQLRLAEGGPRHVRVEYTPRHSATGEVIGFYALVQDFSATNAAEVALRESEARFRNLADTAPVMMWVTEPDGQCSYLNTRWYEFTGQTEAEGLGIGWLDATHPDDRATAKQVFLTANENREAFRLEYRLRRRDGVYRWAIDAASPRLGPQGEFLGYVGSVIDIDDRREMETALRRANERLEVRVEEALAERKVLADIVEGTDAFVQVVDLDFRWMAINKAGADEFERIYGVRPEVGASMLDLLVHKPEHQSAVKAVWSRALAGEEFVETAEFGDPALDRRHYEMKYNALRDPGGRQIGAFQFVYDVTERIREHQRLIEAETARSHSDALYRTYFENTPEALFIVGVTSENDFVVEEINPAHEVGVGMKLEDIQGRRIADILPAAAAERILETYRHVMRTGHIYQYREVYELDGQKRHWDTSLVPMRDEHGQIVRLIGASRDVTPQVLAEEALRQSQKMEAMGQLTGGVAHDFNNLLTPIVGSLDMLQRRGLGGAREQRLIDGAVQSAERARVLVQRLLSFARRQPLQPIAVDVGKLVEGMADLLASTIGPQIKLIVEVSPDLPPARADTNQIEMALLNLGVNARDAMPGGGVIKIGANLDQIELGHRSGLPVAEYIRLSVTDDGAGMDEATMQRAVEPFFSTKGVGRGTGLGLSMVHGLASQLGGALVINSRVGVGTSIELWLPLGLTEQAEAEGSGDSPMLSTSVRTVLLVDDEDLVRASTADMLGELGYEVVEASSAEAALELLRNGLQPGLLVTDHLMPGLSGADLSSAAQEIYPDLLSLVITGYAEVEGLAPSLPRLTKPFNLAELAASVSSL